MYTLYFCQTLFVIFLFPGVAGQGANEGGYTTTTNYDFSKFTSYPAPASPPTTPRSFNPGPSQSPSPSFPYKPPEAPYKPQEFPYKPQVNPFKPQGPPYYQQETPYKQKNAPHKQQATPYKTKESNWHPLGAHKR